MRRATAIVKLLRSHGFIAYFAGGYVRDYLLNRPQQDIDIATDASPEEIAYLFPRTLMVGAQFGSTVVVMEGIHFEVTTFRQDEGYRDGRHPSFVRYSSAEEDAKRRDFTINGMFFDPIDHRILDFVGGKEDVERQVIRAIGDPLLRFQEDRLRMLRAVRFAAGLQFTIESKTEQAIKEQAPFLFPSVSMERVRMELQKMGPFFAKALSMLFQLGLLQVIFPSIKEQPLLSLQPLDTPLLLRLTPLFPEQEWVQVGKYLKVSNRELDLVECYRQLCRYMQVPTTSFYQWAHLFAHPRFLQALPFYISEHSHAQKQLAELQRTLHDDVIRVQERKPIVTALLLQNQGVKPGPLMGRYLRLAEEIAINERITEPQAVMRKLFETLHLRYTPSTSKAPKGD